MAIKKNKDYHIKRFIDKFKNGKIKMDNAPSIIHVGCYWLYHWKCLVYKNKERFELKNEEYLYLINKTWEKKKTIEA